MPQPDDTMTQFLSRPRHSAMLVPKHYAQERREALHAAGFKTSWQNAQSGHLSFHALRVSLGRQGPERLTRMYTALTLIFGSLEDLESFEGRIHDRLLPVVVPKKGDVVIRRYPSGKEKVELEQQKHKAFAAYTPLLSRLAQISGRSIILHDTGERRVPPHPQDGNVHLFRNASPPGESTARYCQTAFGLNIAMGETDQPIGYAPTAGRGIVLKDATEEALVQILGDNWYLLIPTVSYFNPATSVLIFERLLALIWNTLHAGKLTLPTGLSQAAFLRQARLWYEGFAPYVNERIQEMETEIQRLTKQVAELQREILIFRGINEGVINATFPTRARRQLPGELRLIQANPLVDSIELFEDGMHVRTMPLTTEHDGVLYRTGVFTIRINNRGATTVWSEEPTHPDGVPHPHINKYGGPCYGNAGTAIAKAGGEARYADTVNYVLTWLTRGYTHDLASVKIHEWPIAHTEDSDATQA